MRVSFHLNDEHFVLDLSGEVLLLDILRNEFGIISIHSGCRRGHCGSCLVLLNDQAVPACLVPAFSFREARIETVEGISTRLDFVDIERGFLKAGLSPCGFCASSRVLLAESILRRDQEVDSQNIFDSVPAHWCTCSSNQTWSDAILACYEIRKKRVKNALGN